MRTRRRIHPQDAQRLRRASVARERQARSSRHVREHAPGLLERFVPPFGYRVEIKERRGNKDKKVLVVDEDEARVVRKVFAMAAGEEGRPVGVKAIASHLNERGILRRGRRFSTGSIHDILSTTAYYGVHYFNRRDSRNGAATPSQWVSSQVPAIIDEPTFNAVRGADAEP